MKIITVSLLLMSFGYSATVNVISRNGADATLSRIIVDSTGTTLSSGYAAIGFFSTLNSTSFATSTSLELESDFTVLGSTTDLIAEPFGPGFEIPGILEFGASAGDPTNIFTSRPAFLVVGNGNTLSTSTEAFVYLTGLTFGDDLAPPAVLDLSVADPSGSVQLGSESAAGTIVIGTGFSGPVSNAFQTAVLVPEPSSLILSMIGTLALLRRKR